MPSLPAGVKIEKKRLAYTDNREEKTLFGKKTSNAKREIEALFHEIQINLENNYKDLAISARKQAEEALARCEKTGELKDKDYRRLKQQLDDYTKRMEGYHH